MLKLAVFDLDDTLAPTGRGMSDRDRELLHTLASRGVRIAVASGKPTFYLSGFMRMVGIPDVILVGENGSEIVMGLDLPPAERTLPPVSEEARAALATVRAAIEETLPGLYYQPNLVMLTPFPRSPEEFEIIEGILDTGELRKALDVYRYDTCFDILPRGFTKASGIAYLAEVLGLCPHEIAAIGNGENDYPMLAFAGLSLGIALPDPSRADLVFPTVTEALNHLLALKREETL